MTVNCLTVRIGGLFFGEMTERWDAKDSSTIGKMPVTDPMRWDCCVSV